MAHAILKNSGSTTAATPQKSIIKRTIEVGSSTLISRILGLTRDLLLVRFLGVGALADAFLTAYKIPNSLRKIFAEGALSAAFIPTFVGLVKTESKQQVSKLMTLSFLVIEGVLLGLCGLIFWKADWVIRFIAPGWYTGQKWFDIGINNQQHYSFLKNLLFSLGSRIAPAWFVIDSGIEQALYATQFLRILIAFIIFLSCSALLASALQSVNHFFVSAFSPVLLNIVFILGLLGCMRFGLSANALCYIIIFGGLLQFLLHLYMYYKLNFKFLAFDQKTKHYFYAILTKFLPCLLAMSILEINLFVITTLASYLPTGSISLINYTNRFMGIPLGIFATAFSTILLPHFSRISTYAPKRLNLYLLEAAKLIFWVTIPTTVIMIILAEKTFLTLFLSSKFTLADVHQASAILSIFSCGLFIFSLNKIILNIFYAFHNTLFPTLIAIVIALCNYFLCKVFIVPFGAKGLALGFLFSSCLQTIIFLATLPRLLNLTLYLKPFYLFAYRAIIQLVALMPLFIALYWIGQWSITTFCTEAIASFLLNGIGFWFWIFPLLGIMFLLFLKTRHYFGIHLIFLD